jgi:hypothetical protein
MSINDVLERLDSTTIDKAEVLPEPHRLTAVNRWRFPLGSLEHILIFSELQGSEESLQLVTGFPSALPLLPLRMPINPKDRALLHP